MYEHRTVDIVRCVCVPGAVLVLRELDDVVGELAQLQVGEAVVAEVLEQAAAASGRLVAHERAHAHAAHAHAAHANAAHAHAAAHQLCNHTLLALAHPFLSLKLHKFIPLISIQHRHRFTCSM